MTKTISLYNISVEDILYNDIVGYGLKESEKMESMTDSTYLILLSLLEPRHGYAIMKGISEMTHDSVTIGPASMYTILKKLEKKGDIRLKEDKDRKKIYVITSQGQEELIKEVDRRRMFYEAGRSLLMGDRVDVYGMEKHEN